MNTPNVIEQSQDANAGCVQRVVRRREEDEYLRAHGWAGGGGEWRHPWKRGVYLKWVALIMEKEMQQMKRGTTPNEKGQP
jgi:hypothetical protein